MSKKKITSTIKSERYIIDGKEYQSLSDIPEPERKKLDAHFKVFEDKDKDGIPDIFQGKDATTSSYTESKVVRVSSNDNVESAGELFKSIFQNLGVGPFGTEKQEGEKTTRKDELSLFNRDQGEPRKKRVRNYIVILALIAVIVYLVLKQLYNPEWKRWQFMETDKETLGYIVYSVLILFMTSAILYATWKDKWNKREMKFALLAVLFTLGLGIITATLSGNHSITNTLLLKVVDNKATLGGISAGYSIFIVSIIKTIKHVLLKAD